MKGVQWSIYLHFSPHFISEFVFFFLPLSFTFREWPFTAWLCRASHALLEPLFDSATNGTISKRGHSNSRSKIRKEARLRMFFFLNCFLLIIIFFVAINAFTSQIFCRSFAGFIIESAASCYNAEKKLVGKTWRQEK